MDIKTTDELRIAVNNAIKNSGVTKTYIAEKIGLSRQGLDKVLIKKQFTLDDANLILDVINKRVCSHIIDYEVKKV